MSQLRHVELADECESIKTNTNYVLAGFMTHWRAGSRACSRLNFCEFFFSLKKLSQLRGAEPATRRWASYVALSQLRGTEPATWHWASKVALSFELARRQWASKVALSFIIYIYIYIYIPMQSQPYNMYTKSRAKHFFLRETRTFELERECEIYHSTNMAMGNSLIFHDVPIHNPPFSSISNCPW